MNKLTNYEKHFRDKLKNKNFKMAFGKESHRLRVVYKIIQLRKKQHLSQERLAQKIGTTQSVISRIEAGQENLTIDNLQKIASTFGLNLDIKFIK